MGGVDEERQRKIRLRDGTQMKMYANQDLDASEIINPTFIPSLDMPQDRRSDSIHMSKDPNTSRTCINPPIKPQIAEDSNSLDKKIYECLKSLKARCHELVGDESPNISLQAKLEAEVNEYIDEDTYVTRKKVLNLYKL